MNNETLADILAEMRDPNSGLCRWYADGGNCDCPKCAFDALADRIEAACQREAALLIPAKNIEFFDGNGRRQIASGWVKKGGAE